MDFFLRKHTYFHGSDILLDLKVMLGTRLIIGSIFNVLLETKAAFLGPLISLVIVEVCLCGPRKQLSAILQSRGPI